MEFQSGEVIERFKEKIPLLKNVDYQNYGITQLDIICEKSNCIRQYVLAFERLQVIEPTEYIKLIYADVYLRIKDENLYRIAIKEISIDDALSQKLLRVYGDKEIWQLQLKALKEILPYEHFSVHKKNAEEIKDIIEDNGNEEKVYDEEWYRRTDLSTIPPQLKFLADALAELQKNSCFSCYSPLLPIKRVCLYTLRIMRTIAAVAVIILISLYQCDSASDKQPSFDAFDALKSSLGDVNDQKVSKNYGNFGCPACDSSVYSYCDQKIFHDACCCGLNQQPQCRYTDCSYIYANSCQEHQLITNCCCYNPYRNLQQN